MAKTRQQKEETVKNLTDKLSKATAVVFADYKGLKTSQLNELRNRLRNLEAEFAITKNALLKLALKEAGLKTLTSETFEGPTATLFAYDDAIPAIKTLVKTLKDATIGKIKVALLESEVLDALSVDKLATLPDKDELRAQIVGSLSFPLYGMVGVLQANLRNLVYAFEQIRIQKGGEV